MCILALPTMMCGDINSSPWLGLAAASLLVFRRWIKPALTQVRTSLRAQPLSREEAVVTQFGIIYRSIITTRRIVENHCLAPT